LNDFIELRVVNRQRLGDRRQWRLAFSTLTGASQVFGRNAVLLSAGIAGAYDGHFGPHFDFTDAWP
jgi:hypothetical protein